MRNISKKVLCLFLVFLLSFEVLGCKKNEEEKTDSTEEKNAMVSDEELAEEVRRCIETASADVSVYDEISRMAYVYNGSIDLIWEEGDSLSVADGLPRLSEMMDYVFDGMKLIWHSSKYQKAQLVITITINNGYLISVNSEINTGEWKSNRNNNMTDSIEVTPDTKPTEKTMQLDDNKVQDAELLIKVLQEGQSIAENCNLPMGSQLAVMYTSDVYNNCLFLSVYYCIDGYGEPMESASDSWCRQVSNLQLQEQYGKECNYSVITGYVESNGNVEWSYLGEYCDECFTEIITGYPKLKNMFTEIRSNEAANSNIGTSVRITMCCVSEKKDYARHFLFTICI